MKIDIVIPTYNRGSLVVNSIKSACIQAPFVGNIFLVDNGSVRVGRWVNDFGVVLIEARVGLGASEARNIGASMATTKYIAFLDDDDYWMPEYLKNAIPLLETEVDIVVGKLMRQSDGCLPYDYKLLDDSFYGLREIYYKNPGFGGQNIIVRRELFEKIGGFDVNLPASNDRDFAVRAMQAGATIKVQPLSVAVLCDHAGERVRSKQVMGNYLFINKHWRYMRLPELALALWTLSKRFIKVKLGH